MLLDTAQLACARGQQEACDLLFPSRDRKQGAAFEKQDHCIGRGFDRERMFRLIRPSKELSGGMEGHDGTRAVLKSLAAANYSVDGHEDIVSGISLTDDCAVAPITDRAAPHGKNGALREFVAILENKRVWEARFCIRRHAVRGLASFDELGSLYNFDLAHRIPRVKGP